MTASNYVHLDVDLVKRITDKAMLCVIDGEDVWLPLSQVADADSFDEGDEDCTVSVTQWIAEQKGLGGEQ
jgi:hypothetical protein